MTDDDRIVAEAAQRVESTSIEAVAVALRHIAIHEPFATEPDDTGERDLIHFQQIAKYRLVDKGELLKMAEKNLARYVAALRSRVVIYPHLNAVRVSVVALAIRIRAVLDCKLLWTAIARSDWESAADELWLTMVYFLLVLSRGVLLRERSVSYIAASATLSTDSEPILLPRCLQD